ncbi:unnamed protein product [Closterium sp. NIES-53]
MTPRKELLDDVRAVPINEVCSASGHALKVAGAGRAAFKGADGKPVVLHDVLLVPDLKANLISLRKPAKAGVSTSTDGARTYKGQLGNRVLWDLHESKDVYRSISGETDWATAHRRLGHLKKQGIQRELTTAYTPQSNGVAERANRTILETARALLIESGVGNSMWPHAVRHATVARNRVLTKSLTSLKKYRSKLGANAIWYVHLGVAAESKGWLLWEPSKGVLFDSRDVKFVEGMMYGGWKKQPETKVSQQMEQITMQLDLTPSVWEEGEEAAAEGGDGKKVQEAPTGGGDDVETSGSTKEAAGSEEGEQQQGKAKVPALPSRRKPKGVVMRGWETPVSRPGRTRMAAMKLTAGADVAEQQLGNEGKKAVQCKWVLRIKTNHKGQVTIYKSRLVAKGFMQKEKQDFNENFAPTAKPPTLRVLLADAAVSGKSIIQMDISTAFLNGILEEDVYITQPPGYEDGTGRVCKLKKSIKWHWLRKEVKRGTVNPIYIKTHQQPADFLTKRLPDEPHWRCVRMSGMSMN